MVSDIPYTVARLLSLPRFPPFEDCTWCFVTSTKFSLGSVHPSMFSLTLWLCFSSPFYLDSFPHVLAARTIVRIKRTTPVNPLSTPCYGQVACYPHSTVYIFFHTLMTPLPPFLHPLVDFGPKFGGIVNQLQRQIKAVGSCNPKSTLVFPLPPPILSCVENKFPPLLHLHFIFRILPKEQMSSRLLTSPDTQRNQGSRGNLPRVTQPMRSKSEI